MADRDNPGGISLDFTGAQALLASLHRMKPRKLTEAGVEHLSFGDADGRARNLVIEGDNLQALASLPRQYSGRIDFIYADPPYNTGTTKENFRYNDKWLYDPDTDDPGSFVTDSTPGRHERWMNFMYPRLHACKRMLKPGGVIAVSIDDRELARLILLMDAVFSEGNRLGLINWQKKYSPSNDSRHLSPSTEYVLVYANREDLAVTRPLGRTEAMDARYANPDDDPDGPWTSGDIAAKNLRPTSCGIQSPFTGEMQYPPDGGCWRSTGPTCARCWRRGAPSTSSGPIRRATPGCRSSSTATSTRRAETPRRG